MLARLTHVSFLDVGCSQLSIAIADRDQVKVERLLNGGVDANTTDTTPYSPLCFATKWPIGIEILLRAGADPSQAVHCAVAYEDEVGLRMLLDQGCFLFTPLTQSGLDLSNQPKCLWNIWQSEGGSILSYALRLNQHREGLNPTILSLIVQALARSRRSLMKLARQHVPVRTLRELGWNHPYDDTALLDSSAAAVFGHLQGRGTTNSNFLWPGFNTTVYHHEWMTSEVAEALFLEGFKEIDLPDPQGITPLLLNCHGGGAAFRSLECLIWLIQHGAKLVIFPSIHRTSIMHKLAADLGENWTRRVTYEHLRLQAKTLLSELLTLLKPLLIPMPRDDCECFCSESGCTPVHSFLKMIPPSHIQWRNRKGPSPYPTWLDREALLDMWGECCPEHEERATRRRAACRFEMFSRLGMRHTCCKFSNYYGAWENTIEYLYLYPYLGPNIHIRNEDDKEHIQDDDQWLKMQLDAIMQIYEDLERQFHQDHDLFWIVWWEVLEDVVPQELWIEEPEYGLWEKVQGDSPVICEDELPLKLDEIQRRVRLSMLQSFDREIDVD